FNIAAMNKILPNILLVALVLFASCYYNKEDFVVPNNQAPPDPTVSNLVKENYVNKIYISVLGRKPLEDEFDQGLAIIDQDNLSLENRDDFLDLVFKKPEYFNRVYELARVDLLNALDTVLILEYIFLLDFLLQQTQDAGEREVLIYEQSRLIQLREVPQELENGNIDVVEVHRRCLNNLFYDEINMGTENFVVSVFQNLLFRFPSSAENIDNNELENGKMIVDGFESVLFFQVGSSKQDFMDIFLASNDYFEGQVRGLYNRFLFREPDSEEMSALAVDYAQDRDYVKLQKAILSLDEYVGID
ncbi:MAG: hypothetical protein O6848_08295, partial [Bacteroidetes bacterium]|nr:hypothetical protein [Bacteroidota bacterium]